MEFFSEFSSHRRSVDPAWTAAAVRAAVADSEGRHAFVVGATPTEVTSDQDRDRGDPRGRPEALVALRKAMHELTAAGFTVVLHDQDLPTPHGDLVGARRPETADAEIVVVLGGDGRSCAPPSSRAGRRHPSSASTSATWDSRRERA